MPIWTDPPDQYEYWSWYNEEGQGPYPTTQWDNEAEARQDLEEHRQQMPDVARYLVHVHVDGDREEVNEQPIE